MDPETGSTNTSLEDKTDDFCENPTRDSLVEGLMSVLKPTIDQLDERVRATRVSQLELKQQLESLSEELKNITHDQNCPLDLESYSQKLLNSRHKITVVSNILQAAQDRLHKVQNQISKENAKRKIVVDNPQTTVSALDPEMETPLWKFDENIEGVYEPREDSFLLLDSIEADLKLIKDKCHPTIALEVGSGSGIIISAVSKALNSSTICLAIDINSSACKITSQTASLNNVTVEVLRSDLLCGLKLDGLVDLFLINPPYVPSTEEEENSVLDKAWAGLDQGRVLINRLFKDLPHLMSEQCLGYLVAIEENNPEEISNTLNSLGFNVVIVARKKIIGEKLSIIRFSKGIV